MTGGGFGGPNPFGGQPGPGPHGTPSRPSGPPQGPPPGQQPPWGGGQPGPRQSGGPRIGGQPAPPQWGGGVPQQPRPFGNQLPPPPFPGQSFGPPPGQSGFGPAPSSKPGIGKWLKLPSSKRGRRIVLAAGAVAAVAALVAGGVMAFGGSEYEGGTGTASDAVTAYIEALQRGDVKAALSLGREQPPDTSMLTEEILNKQMEKYPISDIKILGDIPTRDGGARVHVVGKVGGVEQDKTFTLPKPPPGEGWKLKTGAMAVEFHTDNTNAALKNAITVWGKPVPKTGKAYMFPGLIDIASSNPSIDVETRIGDITPSLQQLVWMSDSVFPDFEVSEQGERNVLDAVKKALEECAKSTSLKPPGCPNGAARSDFVPDSAQWTAPADIKNFSIGYIDEKAATVTVTGNPEFGVTVKTTSGQTESGTFTPSLYVKVDLATNPPTVEFN